MAETNITTGERWVPLALLCGADGQDIPPFPPPSSSLAHELRVHDPQPVVDHPAVERLEIGARKLGAKGEDRRYVPHLTLGRVQRAPQDFAERLASVKKPVLGTVQAQELTLFMSELTRQGSTYTALDRIAFGA